MLRLLIPGDEEWDEVNEEFILHPDEVLELEHSLVSLSKWESSFHKSFLDSREKGNISSDEWLAYIRAMTINTVNDEIYERLGEPEIKAIFDYINDSMTATWFSEPNPSGKPMKREIITAEIIYYWMVTLNIPFECLYWHLNRLLTLIRVCSEKNKPPEKMTKQQTMMRNKALNQARRAKLKSKG